MAIDDIKHKDSSKLLLSCLREQITAFNSLDAIDRKMNNGSKKKKWNKMLGFWKCQNRQKKKKKTLLWKKGLGDSTELYLIAFGYETLIRHMGVIKFSLN